MGLGWSRSGLLVATVNKGTLVVHDGVVGISG